MVVVVVGAVFVVVVATKFTARRNVCKCLFLGSADSVVVLSAYESEREMKAGEVYASRKASHQVLTEFEAKCDCTMNPAL